MKMMKVLAGAVLFGLLGAPSAFAGGFTTNGLPVAGAAPYAFTLPLTGNEQAAFDTQLTNGQAPQSEAITINQISGAAGSNLAYTTNSATASTTVTAAQIAANGGQVYLDMTGSLGAAGTLTTPTAAQIIAQVPNATKYLLRVINETAATNAWTLTGGTGVTVNGTATIAAASWTDFVGTINASAGTVTYQRVGSGTK